MENEQPALPSGVGSNPSLGLGTNEPPVSQAQEPTAPYEAPMSSVPIAGGPTMSGPGTVSNGSPANSTLPPMDVEPPSATVSVSAAATTSAINPPPSGTATAIVNSAPTAASTTTPASVSRRSPAPAPVLSSISQQQQQQQQPAQPEQAQGQGTMQQQAGMQQQQQSQQQSSASRAQAQSQAASASTERSLNVTDALSYLDAVKSRFANQSDVYNRFLDIMKDFKTQVIDTPGVIERVSQLFNAHPDLIHGFNTFLPVGYRIEVSPDGSVFVRTPTGTSHIRAQPRDPNQPPSKPDPNNPNPWLRGIDMTTGTSSGGAFHSSTQQSQPHGTQAPYHTIPVDMGPGLGLGMVGVVGMGFPGADPSAYGVPHGYAPHDMRGMPGGMGQSGMGGGRTIEEPVSGNDQGEFARAIAYVSKIKTRFSGEPETYKMFLELLQRHHAEGSKDGKGEGGMPINHQVTAQIESLLRPYPDLLAEFKDFRPDGRTNVLISAVGNDWAGSHKRKEANSALLAPPAKRKKKLAEKEREREREREQREREREMAREQKPSSARQPKKKHRTEQQVDEYMYDGTNAHGAGMSTPDDQAFFERVKAYLDNRVTYDEFLKLLNLFSQDIIDMKTLVEKSQVFLGEGSELQVMFQRMIGWEERERLVRDPDDTNTLALNGGGMTGGGGLRNEAIYVRDSSSKEDLHHKCGPSYRRIPANEAHIACSGRDELCRAVLNDEWVSHPTWASEDNSGFQSHKKNQYEEALHKCEEERHEFDFHLEIMSKTITALENINMKISQMSTDEKGTFKLKPGLGLPNKSIYQRIIKKVYGKDAGMEVIATLHDCPAVAVPIVLARLKSKDEEWRRAQREWNKVWREVDARNFYKSLDHLGVTFKSTDKKAMTTKALVATIEAARDEQISQRMALVDSSLARTKPAHQLAYEVHDRDVMKDAVKLILAYLDRLGAVYTIGEREKIERWLLDFLVIFFCLDKAEFEEGLKDHPHVDAKSALGVSGMVPVDAGGLSMELDPEDIEPTPSGAASGRRTPTKGKGRSIAVNSQDLRKSLLSKANAASRSHSTKNSPAITPAELPAAPATTSAMDTEVKEEGMPVDSVWIATASDPMEAPTSNLRASSNFNGKSSGPAADRKATFFGNTATYVILRIFHTLYSRLLLMKETTAELSQTRESHRANPIALELGLLEGLGPGTMNLFAPTDDVELNPDGTSFNPVSRFYDHLLECCDGLFAGDMDQNTFEENLRFMVGTKGYLMFTVDKVIAALIKQIHTAITDLHTEELMSLLKKERHAEEPTAQQIITYRRNAEDIIGQDDSLFRINWDHGVMTMQLLGKADPSTDDAETIAQRWKLYIESYVLTHPTEGIRREPKNPFLRRNFFDAPLTETGCHAKNGLEIRVCIRTYRIFFVSDTADYFWRFGDGARKQAMEFLPGIEEKKKARFDMWLEHRRARKDKAQSSTKKTEEPVTK